MFANKKRLNRIDVVGKGERPAGGLPPALQRVVVSQLLVRQPFLQPRAKNLVLHEVAIKFKLREACKTMAVVTVENGLYPRVSRLLLQCCMKLGKLLLVKQHLMVNV